MGSILSAKMAADLFLATVCALLGSFPILTGGQSNRTTFSPSSTSGCTCDLTGNGCDVNCCCDTDCSNADQQAFTECKDTDINRDDRVCLSNAILFTFRQNTNFRTQTSGSGLFCIIRDNYESRNFYNDVQNASTSEEFSNLKSQSTSAVYDYNSGQTDQTTTASPYKVGDPVRLVFDNGVRGFLSLPRPLFGSECDDNNPAGYRENNSTECSRTIPVLASACEDLSVLSARSYLGFKVIKNPAVTDINSTSNSTSSVSTPVVLKELSCKTNLGKARPCSFDLMPPDPAYDAENKTCHNVALEVSYTVQYSNSSTDIVSVEVDIVLGSVTADVGLDLRQKVSISFSKAGGNDTAFQRSGNPGYIIGKPLVAGKLVTVDSKDAIFLSSDSNTWLTIISPSANGACDNSTARTSVTFGVDMRTGCTISVALKESKCTLIQERVLNTLLGDPPTHVASFGNSAVNNVGDWVKILNVEKPANEAREVDGECRNMILGLHIEVLFANFGFLANPQPRIVGVMYKYDDPKDIKYQCAGVQCQPGSSSLKQQVEVVTSVGFVDVSDKPVAQIKPRPTFEAKASSDFFFPFL